MSRADKIDFVYFFQIAQLFDKFIFSLITIKSYLPWKNYETFSEVSFGF